MADRLNAQAEWVVLGHRLTEPQADFLLFLPPDGSWRRTSESDFNRYGPNALRGFGQSGLIEGYYQEVMRHRLTRAGIDVAAALRARASGDNNHG